MLEIAVFNPREHFQTTVTDSSFTIGSSGNTDANTISINDDLVSEFQCLFNVVENKSETRLKITNLGSSLVLGDGSRIHNLVTREVSLPCSVGAGETQIQIGLSQLDSLFDNSIQRLANIGTSSPLEVVGQTNKTEVSPSAQTLTSWFEAIGQIQRSAAGQAAFFELAARSVFNPGGLDGCIILRRQSNHWVIVSQHIPYPESGISYRKDLVQQALELKLPLFHDSSELRDIQHSDDIHAAVVCPVFDKDHEVVAMVYGFRINNRNNNRKGIRFLEAKFVSLVADSISAGMVRLENEADRARQRVLLEQAFPPEVVVQLEADPDSLMGKDSEVSVLFADLRGFCKISEKIGARLTYQLLTDVMNRFTQIVHEHQGVVIDFFGDGISAFWNAPVEQPDHPVLACRAGLAIEKSMSDINDVWSFEIGTRIRVGVGIHTGIAQVGNSGSQYRLKYGPQGNTVNIASRLEQATKKFGVGVVVSGATAKRVTDHFIGQRICTARLPGIQTNTKMFKLVEPVDYSRTIEFYEGYSIALQQFESAHYIDALESLTKLENSNIRSDAMLTFLLKEINDRLRKFHTQLPSRDSQNADSDAHNVDNSLIVL